MRFRGSVQRDGRHWLAEVPLFDALTQGRTREEALAMIVDWFETMIGARGFTATVRALKGVQFELEGSDAAAMVSLLLRRQRQRSGLSLADVAARLGAKSRNAYARYEQGVTVPTVARLDALLKAVAPDRDLVVTLSDAA
jgi:predicted RNase H-like HicB family nuclease